MLLCFTDLDGTLLNHDDYRYDAAIPLIRQLQALGVPVIPTTSKTRAEVIGLRATLGLRDPFIVENGSGIFLEPNDQRFQFDAGTIVDGFERISLGVSYRVARQALQQISQAIGERLVGFGDMTEAQVQAATDLPLADVRQACDREFSEPFLRPKTDLDKLESITAARQLQILIGNRFCHLLGRDASKGEAVNRVKQAYCQAHPGAAVVTVGLGDSPNDISLLEAVDYPIVIPGVCGPHPALANRYPVAPDTGCCGWAAAVTAVMTKLALLPLSATNA